MKNNISTYFSRVFLGVTICLFLCPLQQAQGALITGNSLFQQQDTLPAPTTLQVQARIDSQQIKIGEQFHLTLQATADTAVDKVIWAEVPDSFNHLLVVERKKVDTLTDNGKILYQQQLILTSFDSGLWHIPAFDFKAIQRHDTASKPASVSTDSLAIIVHTVPVDTTKPFNPIKKIIKAPFNLLDYWPYLLGGLIILLILIYLIFFYKKKGKQEVKEIIPRDPPYDQALRNLHALEEEKLWQQGQIKPYYTRLTDILRLYIERQFNINAMEQTSDELLDKIKPVTRLNQQRNNLQYILQTADLTKFAKLQPQQEEHESCLKKAYEIIEWAKPQETVEIKEKGKDAVKNTDKKDQNNKTS